MTGDPIWDYPYEGLLRQEKVLQLYKEDSKRVDILIDDQNLQVFGYNDQDGKYANLVMLSNWWMLWGFQDGPSKMTDLGQRLFVNTAHRTLR